MHTGKSGRGGDRASLTVILPTYNRSESLRMTLDALASSSLEGLDVEFVVVENDSAPHVRELVESFGDRIPVKYLLEPKQGRNAALNAALDTVPLREIVVFTEDDITPRKDWLQQVASVCRRWPDYDAFGGRCRVLWPVRPVPRWALEPSVIGWGFGYNADIGDNEMPYPARRFPVGFNYWVRRRVFEDGRRYEESIGPMPLTKTMGAETAFLMKLVADGYRILYAPHAVVDHRVQPGMVTPEGIRKRAATIGRTGAYFQEMSGRSRYVLERNPVLWRVMRIISLSRYALDYAVSWLIPFRDTRVMRSVQSIRGMTYNYEILRLMGRLKNA